MKKYSLVSNLQFENFNRNMYVKALVNNILEKRRNFKQKAIIFSIRNYLQNIIVKNGLNFFEMIEKKHVAKLSSYIRLACYTFYKIQLIRVLSQTYYWYNRFLQQLFKFFLALLFQSFKCFCTIYNFFRPQYQ